MYLGLLTTSCLLSSLLLGVDGHGAITGISGSAKGARNWQAHRGQHPGLREYDPYSLNGQGGRVDQTNSPCGEPGQTQHPEQYKSMEDKWIIKTAAGTDWSAGQEVEFDLRITANHGGTIEYRWMCGDGKATTEVVDFYDEVPIQPESACYGTYPTGHYRNGKCLKPRLLERVRKGETFSYWPSEPNQYILSQSSDCQEPRVDGVFKMTYKLPVTQCRRIVIQWWWTTSNSCVPPSWKAARNTDFPCKAGNWPNYGLTECNGRSGTAWGSGEQFANCMDLVIGDSPAPSPKPPAPSPPVVSPPALPSPVPSPVPSPNPNPSPVPPTGNGVQRKVIYLGWDLVSYNNLMTDLMTVVNSGYNVINLAFWLIRSDGSIWVADSAGVWQGMSIAQKQASLDLVHNAGARLMVSCGGATMDLENVMERYMTGTQFGQACAQFAADNMLDGVDFDLETHPGNSAPFRDGSLINWAVDATRAARAVLGSQALISHAPQSPYAGTWAGSQKGYVEIMRLAGSDIDFLNMQYYNQGAGIYTTYEQTFVASSGWWSETSVSEMVRNGIALNKIVIGKYFSGDGGSGYISAATMAQWTSRAQTELGWTAGIMNWVHKHSQSDRTRAWGAAIPLGSTTPTVPSPVPSPQPPAASPSPLPPTEPSPVPSPQPPAASPVPSPQPPAASPVPSPQPPADSPVPSPVPSPQPPKDSPVPSPQPPTEPSPSPSVPSPQPPAPSPAPINFEVTLRQSTQWAGSVRITPYHDVQKAYIVYPGGEKELRPDAAGEWFPVFYWGVHIPAVDQPSCVIKIVDQSDAVTVVPLNWGTHRSMQTLSMEEPTAAPEPSMFSGAATMTMLFAVVGVLLLARRQRQAAQFESLKDIQVSLE